MNAVSTYQSPLGELLLAADEEGLTGMWFQGQKYFAAGLGEETEPRGLPVFEEAKRWLDLYFQGKQPDFFPALHMQGTPFQKLVWELLLQIPYGETITYGELAGQIAAQLGRTSMSAQAVGGAVGHNKISILIPCHRVVGRDQNLTGYAGGLERKKWLLELEKGKHPVFPWNCKGLSQNCVPGQNAGTGVFPPVMRPPGGNALSEMSLAMAYVPMQRWTQTYTLSQGLERGTIFPELDLPFIMGRCRG